jgi:hypothetical protein
MNHKKLYDDEEEVDPEADYVFIVKSSKAIILINQLQELNLVIKEFKCKVLLSYTI